MTNSKLNGSKKPNLVNFIIKYRVKILLSIFLLFLPTMLIIMLYTSTYSQSIRVYFDNEITEDTDYIKDFVKMDAITEFDLIFEWLEYRVPEKNDDGTLANGYYTISLQYVPKANYNITQMMATTVLQVPWTTYRSAIAPTQIFTNPRYMFIPFNFELPNKPLWFVSVTDPILYIKLDYRYQSASTSINKTAYVSIDLSEYLPNRVIPA
jgi:hypothetical protein